MAEWQALANVSDAQAEEAVQWSHPLGVALGKVIVERQDVDARADLYACGVMLYELLTGERPAGTDMPSEINSQVPKHLDEVFRKSYARIDKRYATAEAFLKALTVATPPPLTRPNCARRRFASTAG